MGLIKRLLVIPILLVWVSLSYSQSLEKGRPYIQTIDGSIKGRFSKLVVPNANLSIEAHSMHAHITISAAGGTTVYARELDGDPNGDFDTLVFPNGSLIISGTHVHVTTSVAVETDPIVGAVNGLVKANGVGGISAVTDGSTNWNDAHNHVTTIAVVNGVIQGNGTGGYSAASVDSILVNTVAVADAAGVDLTSGTYVGITLAAGVSPDTATIDAKAGTFVDALMADNALDADKIVGDATDDDDLDVAAGGTGVSTLTDGGILIGNGSGDLVALGVATNGQIPIGDGATDPVLATITGTANEVTVTNGAGTITLDLPLNAGTDITADLEEEVTEGSLADSTIVSADIKNGTIVVADLGIVANIPGQPFHIYKTIIDPLSVQTEDGEICLVPETDAALTITNIRVTLDANANEVAGDVKFADTFIGLASATVIETFDTTSGVRSDDAMSGDATVPAGKCIYLSFDSAPNTAIHQMCIEIRGDYD